MKDRNVNQKRKAILAASMAGLLAVAGSSAFAQSAPAQDEGESCYGVNACKGMGDCGGKAHSCAGMNECKGQGYVKLPAGTCMKIQGGSLTAPAA